MTRGSIPALTGKNASRRAVPFQQELANVDPAIFASSLKQTPRRFEHRVTGNIVGKVDNASVRKSSALQVRCIAPHLSARGAVIRSKIADIHAVLRRFTFATTPDASCQPHLHVSSAPGHPAILTNPACEVDAERLYSALPDYSSTDRQRAYRQQIGRKCQPLRKFANVIGNIHSSSCAVCFQFVRGFASACCVRSPRPSSQQPSPAVFDYFAGQHDHRPGRAIGLAEVSCIGLELVNLRDRPIHRRSHRPVHLHRLVPFDENRRPAIPLQQLLQLRLRDPIENGWVCYFISVEMQDRRARKLLTNVAAVSACHWP